MSLYTMVKGYSIIWLNCVFFPSIVVVHCVTLKSPHSPESLSHQKKYGFAYFFSFFIFSFSKWECHNVA